MGHGQTRAGAHEDAREAPVGDTRRVSRLVTLWAACVVAAPAALFLGLGGSAPSAIHLVPFEIYAACVATVVIVLTRGPCTRHACLWGAVVIGVHTVQVAAAWFATSIEEEAAGVGWVVATAAALQIATGVVAIVGLAFDLRSSR